MKILTVIGARPQFVKAAAISREINKNGKDINEVIIHTGQHFDKNMSDVFFEQMDIPRPNYNLEIAGLSHGAMTGRMLEKVEAVMLQERPDRVLVYGDTNSTLAGALAASKLHIPVAHVEAGLRSFNMAMPEEVNRILTDRVSDILFCPTNVAVHNLQREGYENFDCRVIQTGDVMQDVAMFYADRAVQPDEFDDQLLNEDYVLVTVHRAENTDDYAALREIVTALNKINSSYMPVLIPLHPRTREKLKGFGLVLDCHAIKPVGYLEMLFLIRNSKLVMTDSGGLQKEAFFFSKPCVTMREETEWSELVEHGFNCLAGADGISILKSFDKMRSEIVNSDIDLYGGGSASSVIVSILGD